MKKIINLDFIPSLKRWQELGVERISVDIDEKIKVRITRSNPEKINSRRNKRA